MRWNVFLRGPLAALVVVVCAAAVRGDEAAEWIGQLVLAKTPQALLRQTADASARPILRSLTGVGYHVREVQGDWLKVADGWLLANDVVRAPDAVEYFTEEIARAPAAFAYVGRCLALAEADDFDRAFSDAAEAIRLEPGSARAYLARGTVWDGRGDAEKALADYHRAIQLDSQDPLLYLVRAAAWQDRDDDQKAIADCDAAIRLDAAWASAYTARGESWLGLGDFGKAIADVDEALRLDPRDALALGIRGACWARRQEYEKAIADASEALRLEPTDAFALAVRGVAWAAKGDDDKALADLDESLRLDQTQGWVFGNRGQVRYRKEQYDAALADFSQMILLSPTDATAYRARAHVWQRKGDNSSAIIDLGQYLQLKPDDAAAHASRGCLLLDKRDADAAIADFSEAIRLGAPSVANFVNRGQAHFYLGRREEALADLNRAVAFEPANTDVYLLRAEMFSYDDVDGAIADLGQYLLLKPDGARARVKRGELLLYHKEDVGAALADAGAALAIDPKSTAALILRGRCHEAKDELDKAIADWTASLALDPNSSDAYGCRAGAHGKKKEFEACIADCNQAIRIDPRDAWAYTERGWARGQLGRLDEALADVDEALQIDSNDTWSYQVRGELRQQKGLEKEAKEDFAEVALRTVRVADDPSDVIETMREGLERENAAVEQNPTDPEARHNRGVLHHMRGEHEAALADFDEACRLNPRQPAYFSGRAIVAARLAKYDLAVASYERAAQLDPAGATACFERGLAHAALGDFAAALADWQEAVRRDPAVLLQAEGFPNARSSVPYGAGPLMDDIWDRHDAIAQSVDSLPKDAEHAAQRARALLAQGWLRRSRQQNDAALADLAEAARLDPALLVARLSHATLALLMVRTDEALADVEMVIAAAPSPAAYYWKGMILAERSEYAAALAAFDAAIRLEPRLAPAYVGRGGVRLVCGDVDALADCQEALRLDPKRVEAYELRAEIWRKQGHEELAQQDFGRTVTAGDARFQRRYSTWSVAPTMCEELDSGEHPEVPRYVPYSADDGTAAEAAKLAAQADTHRLKGDFDAALADCGHGIELAPFDADLRFSRGSIHETKRDVDAALADFSDALRLDPLMGVAYVSRGKLLQQRGQAEAALIDFGLAPRLDPDDVSACLARAAMLAARCRYGPALDDLEHALRCADNAASREPLDRDRPPAPETSDPQVRAGLSGLPGLFFSVRVERLYVSVRETALMKLAWLLATCPEVGFRNGPRAVELARQAVAADGARIPEFVATLAAAHAEAGDFAEAVRWQTKALELAEADAPLRNYMKSLLTAFEAGTPYRDQGGPAPSWFR